MPGGAAETPPTRFPHASPDSYGCSIPRRGDANVTFPSAHEPSRLRARPHEQPATPPGGRPTPHRNAKPVERRNTAHSPPTGSRQPPWEKSFKEKPRAGTFSAWLDVDPGTTARRAREEAT